MLMASTRCEVVLVLYNASSIVGSPASTGCQQSAAVDAPSLQTLSFQAAVPPSPLGYCIESRPITVNVTVIVSLLIGQRFNLGC